ncbi:hypothetical protein KSP40_PGU013880 [Platanthera guangdongensis]|uniref:Uncharacterized protein n=1 Tax=Platanthera guangdongensis TaxID=2320717 RepID=A0ABR2LGS1_9ASPA
MKKLLYYRLAIMKTLKWMTVILLLRLIFYQKMTLMPKKNDNDHPLQLVSNKGIPLPSRYAKNLEDMVSIKLLFKRILKFVSQIVVVDATFVISYTI